MFIDSSSTKKHAHYHRINVKNIINLRLNFLFQEDTHIISLLHGKICENIKNMTSTQLTVESSLCVAVKELNRRLLTLFRVKFQKYSFFLLNRTNMNKFMKLIRTKGKINEKKTVQTGL